MRFVFVGLALIIVQGVLNVMGSPLDDQALLGRASEILVLVGIAMMLNRISNVLEQVSRKQGQPRPLAIHTLPTPTTKTEDTEG